MAQINYNIVIVLCPSESRTLNDEYAFYELDKDKEEIEKLIYVGGKIRMQAAVDIASRVRKFIVVGGSKPKVDDMKSYLEQEFTKDIKRRRLEKAPKVIRIESNSDTNGNLWAIKKLVEESALSQPRVAILTNFYHLLRAMRMAKDILPDVSLLPLAAEAIVERGDPAYSTYTQEFLLRLTRETNGLRDWENGEYRDQDKKEAKWKAKTYDTDKILK